MTERVCDASALVALLVDDGPAGRWAVDQVAKATLFAPTLLPFECSNVLRRHELAGLLTSEQAQRAHADLGRLAIELFPYELVATRVWQLRGNLSGYDASYVALAELIGAPLLTLDRKLAKAPKVRCRIMTPPRLT